MHDGQAATVGREALGKKQGRPSFRRSGLYVSSGQKKEIEERERGRGRRGRGREGGREGGSECESRADVRSREDGEPIESSPLEAKFYVSDSFRVLKCFFLHSTNVVRRLLVGSQPPS